MRLIVFTQKDSILGFLQDGDTTEACVLTDDAADTMAADPETWIQSLLSRVSDRFPSLRRDTAADKPVFVLEKTQYDLCRTRIGQSEGIGLRFAEYEGISAGECDASVWAALLPTVRNLGARNSLLIGRTHFGISTYVSEECRYPVYFADDVLRSGLPERRVGSAKCIAFYDRALCDSDPAAAEALRSLSCVSAAYPITTSGKDGEKKDTETLLSVVDRMIENGLTRDSFVIALGGGVLCDTVGMAASLFRRGIRFIRIPTTLIGQVDAGLGIKVGINYAGKKNLLGAFYPPDSVLIDPSLLRGLSKRKYECGLSEILKTAIICDPVLFERLLAQRTSLRYEAVRGSNSLLRSVVTEAAAALLGLLSKDPYEKEPLGRIFDFGHTFSGLIESRSGYRISHGYAVGIEMLFCAFLSRHWGLLSGAALDKVAAIYEATDLIGIEQFAFFDGIFGEIRDTFADLILPKRCGNLNLFLPVSEGGVRAVNLEGCPGETERYLRVLSREELAKGFDEARTAMNKRIGAV